MTKQKRFKNFKPKKSGIMWWCELESNFWTQTLGNSSQIFSIRLYYLSFNLPVTLHYAKWPINDRQCQVQTKGFLASFLLCFMTNKYIFNTQFKIYSGNYYWPKILFSAPIVSSIQDLTSPITKLYNLRHPLVSITTYYHYLIYSILGLFIVLW